MFYSNGELGPGGTGLSFSSLYVYSKYTSAHIWKESEKKNKNKNKPKKLVGCDRELSWNDSPWKKAGRSIGRVCRRIRSSLHYVPGSAYLSPCIYVHHIRCYWHDEVCAGLCVSSFMFRFVRLLFKLPSIWCFWFKSRASSYYSAVSAWLSRNHWTSFARRHNRMLMMSVTGQ